MLPAFSEERVKEGNALTEVAFHAYSMSPHQQLLVTLSQLLRGALSKRVPFGLVAPDPLTEVGKGAELSTRARSSCEHSVSPQSAAASHRCEALARVR